MSEYNPCISCGACCAHFRASFYWSEAAPEVGGTVPPELVDKLNDRFVVMKGTNCNTPYCIALGGTIGEQVGCTIYPLRSSVCRDFPYSWQDGEHNPRCDQARAAWGMPPLRNPAQTQDDPLESLPLVAETPGIAQVDDLVSPIPTANDGLTGNQPPEDPRPDQPTPRPPRVA